MPSSQRLNRTVFTESSVGSSDGVEQQRKQKQQSKSCLVSDEIKNLEAIRAVEKKDGGVRKKLSQFAVEIRYNTKVVRGKPTILVISFLVFAVLCSVGLGLVFYLANEQDGDVKANALDLADETGRWFCK